MKQRIISAAVGVVLLCAVLAMYETAVLSWTIAVVVALASYEMLHACGVWEHRPFSAVIVFMTAVPAIIPVRIMCDYWGPMVFGYAVVVFCALLLFYGQLSVDRAGLAALLSLMVSLSMCSIIWMRDRFGLQTGFYALIVTLIAAWVSDTGAYFAGYFFGKRKLCPVISPKKTVEGAVGGIAASVLAQVFVASLFADSVSGTELVLLLSPILAILGIIGDLSASVIKRHFGIKDYGNIMPGHGGVLDRFDSVLMILPAVYLLFLYYPVIAGIPAQFGG